jgi:hypothetical protein
MQVTKTESEDTPPIYYPSVECNSIYSSSSGDVTDDFLQDVNGFYCPAGKPSMVV